MAGLRKPQRRFSLSLSLFFVRSAVERKERTKRKSHEKGEKELKDDDDDQEEEDEPSRRGSPPQSSFLCDYYLVFT